MLAWTAALDAGRSLVSSIGTAARLHPFIVTFAIVLVALTLACIFVLPRWLMGDRHLDRVKLENDVRTVLLQGLAGLALLGGALITWLQFQATTQATHGQLQLSLDGQLTERFTKAVEQLGSEKLELRLGGIYALERISRDSERDRASVIAILTAFVRQHAPARQTPLATRKLAVVRADVQTVLTVLGRRPIPVYERLDLRGTDLTGVDLASARLDGADLSGARLDRGTFRSASFAYADLHGASLEGADLRGAHLEGVDLTSARLFGANLAGANLVAAVGMTRVQLDEAVVDDTTRVDR
jgi:hypothetical protein